MYKWFHDRIIEVRAESREKCNKRMRPGVQFVNSVSKRWSNSTGLTRAVMGLIAFCAFSIFLLSFYNLTVFCLDKQSNNANAVMVPFVAWLGFKLAIELALSWRPDHGKAILMQRVVKYVLLCVTDPTSWIADIMLIKQVFDPDDHFSDRSEKTAALVTLAWFLIAGYGAIFDATARADLDKGLAVVLKRSPGLDTRRRLLSAQDVAAALSWETRPSRASDMSARPSMMTMPSGASDVNAELSQEMNVEMSLTNTQLSVAS